MFFVHLTKQNSFSEIVSENSYLDDSGSSVPAFTFYSFTQIAL